MFSDPRFLSSRPAVRLLPVEILEDLTDGGETILHTHDHELLNNLLGGSNGGEVFEATAFEPTAFEGGVSGHYHLTPTEHTDLTDAGNSTLHYHAADRDSANFTGVAWTDLTDGGETALHSHPVVATYSTADIFAFAAAHG